MDGSVEVDVQRPTSFKVCEVNLLYIHCVRAIPAYPSLTLLLFVSTSHKGRDLLCVIMSIITDTEGSSITKIWCIVCVEEKEIFVLVSSTSRSR